MATGDVPLGGGSIFTTGQTFMGSPFQGFFEQNRVTRMELLVLGTLRLRK